MSYYSKNTMGYKSRFPTRTSGRDPVSKKTPATATTYGSTYDYRKGSQAPKPASKTSSPAKPKTSSVTVGTAGSTKKTTVNLGTKSSTTKHTSTTPKPATTISKPTATVTTPKPSGFKKLWDKKKAETSASTRKTRVKRIVSALKRRGVFKR